mmetsp:Transcript_2178/g.4466  ORF Transcript_2178/g.4466 Transcript_2178/m.4466 type:complete len:648 (-) Transcript_2178:41-1984(-)|eukprot:CAMPEP_0118805336 /NCGR_PEP_ID=MMETSP1161-20130426/27063_1 /TAXON_ID=249345 /ORGANISM="Picochlorum oklahomensis, Strain CCMP2329" /LENGTH=647 /DNA_ID=CAMNT_0006734283 /DNA_START=156 /DNA_END=2099 /DNA_ORIENTATION=-
MEDLVISRIPPGEEKRQAVPLDPEAAELGENVMEIVKKAETSWLKNEEVLAVLEKFQGLDLSWPQQAATQPEGGRLYIFSRKVCRAFRNDKHTWRKKNDNKTIKETHEKLKVQDKETLNCYYAHADRNDGLQRRCYWILDKRYDDVVMVHYLCTSTSRVAGRVSMGQAGSMTPSGSGLSAGKSSRPKREAAMRKKRYSEIFGEDSVELAGTNLKREEPVQEQRVPEAPRHDAREDLEPYDSFLERIPSDMGVDPSLYPGDLEVSAAQILRVADSSPRKSQMGDDVDRKLSFGKYDLKALLEGSTSPNKISSMTEEEYLVRGFSKVDSLGYLRNFSFETKMGNGDVFDGHTGGAGVTFLHRGNGSTELDKFARSDSYNEWQPSSSTDPESSGVRQNEKVETLRRFVIPGSDSSLSSFASQGFDQSNNLRKRSNPTSTVPPKSMDVRITEAAILSQDANIRRRDMLLSKTREAREATLPSNSYSKMSQDDELIEPPVLFRTGSHIVKGIQEQSLSPRKYPHEQTMLSKESPEKAASLFKQMSIDETGRAAAAETLHQGEPVYVVDELLPGDSLAGFGSVEEAPGTSIDDVTHPSAQGSRDPSFTSMVQNPFVLGQPGTQEQRQHDSVDGGDKEQDFDFQKALKNFSRKR